MFGNKFEAAYAVSCFFKLIGDIIFVIGEFIAEIFTNFNYFFIVIYNADFSENNYTVYIERPFAVFSTIALKVSTISSSATYSAVHFI